MLNWIIAPNDLDGFALSSVDDLLYEKQHAYVGQFYKSADDVEFEITEATIDHWIKTQDDLICEGVEIPMPLEHENRDNPEMRRATAGAYNKKLDSKGRVSLFGQVKFRDRQAAKDLKESQTSIYAERELVTGKGNRYSIPITHVAFTDYPVLPGMDKFVAIAASLKATPVFSKSSFEKDTDMDLTALATTLGVELDEENAVDQITTAFSSLTEKHTSELEELKKLTSELEELKKLVPVKKDHPVIAASLLGMGKENRQNKIDGLLRDGFWNSAQAKEASEKYCDNACITLALSSEATTDDFEFVISQAKLGTSTPLHGDEETRPEEAILQLSRADLNDPKKNVLFKAIDDMQKQG